MNNYGFTLKDIAGTAAVAGLCGRCRSSICGQRPIRGVRDLRISGHEDPHLLTAVIGLMLTAPALAQEKPVSPTVPAVKVEAPKAPAVKAETPKAATPAKVDAPKATQPAAATPTKTDAKTATKAPVQAATIVNLNTATPAELDKLPKIGAARTKAIIAGRPYASVDDLIKKKVLPKDAFEAIKSRVSVK